MTYENQLIEALGKNDTDRILAIQRLNHRNYACHSGGYDERINDECIALFGSNKKDNFTVRKRYRFL